MGYYRIDDGENFKQANLANWKDNSSFWLQGKMRHLHDIWDFTGELIARFAGEIKTPTIPVLMDVGCGEGWLLRLLHEKHQRVRYLGVDFNDVFIEQLKRINQDDEYVSFIVHDIEDPFPKEVLSSVDLAVNIFNFFEVPNVRAAFRNVTACLRPNGILIVGSIDPVMQMLAVTERRDDLKELLKMYETAAESVGYDKDIDVGDQPSGRVYKSVLYSSAFYVQVARESGLLLEDFSEVVKTGNIVPQTYQFLVFRKPNGEGLR